MFKSNNLNSIIDDLSALGCNTDNNFEALRPNTLDLENITNNNNDLPPPDTTTTDTDTTTAQAKQQNNNFHSLKNNATSPSSSTGLNSATDATSLAAEQLTAGFLQTFNPPISKARNQLKELIGKQNKIYIDLSTEKCKLDNSEVAKLQDVMNDVKVYREKLYKIKKQMQNIYQKAKVLKKRALHIQACKEKELQKKIHKQQQEESLIVKQQ